MTASELSQIRVKRKGQVTIPLELRSRLGIEEGTLLEVEEEKGAVVLRLAPGLKTGNVVGEKRYREVIEELDRLGRSCH